MGSRLIPDAVNDRQRASERPLPGARLPPLHGSPTDTRLSAVIGSTPFHDLERGEFADEELCYVHRAGAPAPTYHADDDVDDDEGADGDGGGADD